MLTLEYFSLLLLDGETTQIHKYKILNACVAKIMTYIEVQEILQFLHF